MASTLGKVDKVALPPFEEHKLCQRTSHAQFQITLSTAALSYHTLEKSQIRLRRSTATLRFGEKSDYTECCCSLLPHTGEKSD